MVALYCIIPYWIVQYCTDLQKILSHLALFMFRKPVEGLPDQFKDDYTDSDPKCVEKVKLLKSVIQSKFPVSILVFLRIFIM